MAMKFLQAINNYLFVRQAKQYISETERERRFVSYDKAKSVLILFESDFTEKNPAIRRMIAQLQQDGKKVSAWGFIDKKEIMTSILPDFRILHHKQTDFFQKPVISYINELEVLEFDLLLDLTIQPILPLQYFALYSKCITKSEIVCYEDLGAEAIRKLQVKDFPVIVVIDSEGNNLYETAIKKYCTLE
jgi:hypothetical protein